MDESTLNQYNDLTRAKGMITPLALMGIKSIELRAKMVVEGFLRGIHRSPFHGFSVEFSEYRQYIYGDDTRHIDWRLFARSDRLFIKKFEDETNLRCHLLVDHSRSMGYSSAGFSKAKYAATLAATLSYLLFMQGDAVGLATFDEKINHFLPPRNRPGYLHRLMLLLDKDPQGIGTDLGRPLKRIAEIITRRGLLVLISDLLAPIDELESHLAYLRASGQDLIVFQVLDPAEMNFSFETPSLFRDMENNRNFYVDPVEAKSKYQSRLHQHLESIQSTCRNLGIDYRVMATDRPLEFALLDFLISRARLGKRIKQNRRMNIRSRT
ncbi:MAG: hypothetical protein AMJ79_06860 [Phycisphaerae bacterium SM23_30]|nr:MAG: hypothetical protein AMJ79_06860 [Phycisphaerae bacterium SM23_30]